MEKGILIMKNIRVRFAPSPTGPLHIGGLRTALYNYLLAKKYNGSLILRIEDTDKKRLIPESEPYIFESMKWCGIIPDEDPINGGNFGPYRQSERISIYKKYITELMSNGNAYYAFDTKTELDSIRNNYKKLGKVFTYNPLIRNKLNNSLSLSIEKLNIRFKLGIPYVIRFKNPINKLIEIKDEIRGNIYFNSNILDDKILMKSDGNPTYHITNVIDDHLMNINLVIRGEEWISSTPLHELLYSSYNWNPPKFAHLPLILNPYGKGKISKRNISTFTILPLKWLDKYNNIFIKGYRELGYFYESIINMIALLGWNPGNKEEIFSLKTLIKKFSIDKINKSSARFDKDKIRWINKQFLNNKPIQEIINLFSSEAESQGISIKDYQFIKKIVELNRKRAYLIQDMFKISKYFFRKPYYYEEKDIKKIKNKILYLKIASSILYIVENLKDFILKRIFYLFIKKYKINPKSIMLPIRLALVGALYGDDLFILIEIIGRRESINRIKLLYKKVFCT
jgi:glutamyl-tRNA synthetase